MEQMATASMFEKEPHSSNPMYQKALRFITEKHAGQKRRNGNPYIIHPIRVSQEVHSDTEKVVALLHDVLEDTTATYDEVLGLFGEEIAIAVLALTKTKGEPYMEYIHRVKRNPLAITVKIADMSDNLSDSPSDEAIDRSAKALDFLING